jgi:hypothetical protein
LWDEQLAAQAAAYVVNCPKTKSKRCLPYLQCAVKARDSHVADKQLSQACHVINCRVSSHTHRHGALPQGLGTFVAQGGWAMAVLLLCGVTGQVVAAAAEY